MKLIVVDRRKAETYRRLTQKFADDPDVAVVFDRRVAQRRSRTVAGPERRSRTRRRLVKDWAGKDYIVIQVAQVSRRR